MKKLLSVLIISSSIFSLSFSEPLKQFQTFSWKKVSKAKKYEITIEKESADKADSYVPELSQQLTDNRVELLLYPGNYRVAISVFNVLGKKTSTTDWTNFIILDETEPYLYANSFKTSKRWNSPVLNLKQDGVQIVEEEDDEGAITAREGDPTNSFFLHGKNIFFEETSFSMVPKATSELGKPFEAYVDKRKEIQLNIVRRDTENGGIVVEYSPDALFSGYYDIVAKNPGGEQTALELLVLSYQAPEIDNSIYVFDENYKVNILNVIQGYPYEFKIRGKGFDSNTLYSFTPDSSLPPYPFASGFDLVNPSFTLSSHECLDETGTIEIAFNLLTQNLHTGYYRFDANNGVSGSDSTVFLINVTPSPSNAPEIQKVKTKAGGDADTIMLNVTGQNIDEDSKITLISSYSEADDANTRISLTYLATKKKGNLHIMQTDKTTIEEGRYALLVENNVSSALFYFDIDDRYNFDLCDISEAEKESLFLRPKSKKQVTRIVEKVIEPEFSFIEAGLKYRSSIRAILPAAHLNLTYVNIPETGTEPNNFEIQAKLDLLYFQWVRLNVGCAYYSWKSFGIEDLFYGGDLFFEIPGDNFQPFIGGGIYKSSTNNDYYTIPITAGIRVFKIFEISYQLALQNALSSELFATDKISFGIQVPLRSLVYHTKSTESNVIIAENNILDGANYELRKDTTYLSLDSQRIAGFSGNTTVRSITLSSNVESIEPKTFADMPNLSSITMCVPIQSIGSQAFANDTSINEIRIPDSVTTIGAGAFEGWTSAQRIVLLWTSDDETPRDLSGLNNTDAYIIYIDNVPYLSENGLYNVNNWQINKGQANVYTTFTTLKIGQDYKPGIYFSGNTLSPNPDTSFIIYKDSFTDLLADKKARGIKFYVDNTNNKSTVTFTLFYKANSNNNLRTVTFTINPNEYTEVPLMFDGTLDEISHFQIVPNTALSAFIVKIGSFEVIE